MPKLAEQRILPHSAKQIFDLVCDIESYPQFLPWCANAKIIKQISPNNLQAQLAVEFKGIFEHYLSDVSFGQKTAQNGEHIFWVEAIAVKGPFKSLVNNWQIAELSDASCKVDFFLNFEFNSALLGKMFGGIFSAATAKMMQAFEDRASYLALRR